MISETKVANAMGGNTARACDSCLVKRARWFCGADDAFLCQRCDATVHSANQLASRHERVRLKTSSNKVNNHLCMEDHGQAPVPAWQQGVTRKARTPRGNKGGKDDQAEKVLEQPMPFVPEMGIEEEEADYFLENDHESEDLEQLLCRVPIFEPFESELCNNMTNTGDHEIRMESSGHDDCGHAVRTRSTSPSDELEGLHGLMLPSDMELAEFAADVENMLGKGLDEECNDNKGLGLLDENGKEEVEYGNIGVDVCIGIEERNKLVKVEEELDHEEMECQFNPSILDWNLDYDDESTAVLLGGSTSTDQDEEKVMALMDGGNDRNEEMMMKRKWKKICLRLDYESVITAWDGQVSPWTTGVKPDLNPDDGWPNCMGMWGADHIHNLQGLGEIRISGGCTIGMRGDIEAQQRPGREARVLRYREKRRTRLFSKKIRYEVRKLNAEKRPRMKGRFVKRASFQLGIGTATATTATNASPYQHLKK